MQKGTVIETTGSWHEIKTDDGNHVKARLKGKLRLENLKVTNPIAVGDRVTLGLAEEDHSITIEEIEPRKNQIIRLSPRKKRYHHILAANIDQAIVIASMRMPKTKRGFISRVLVALEYYEIPTLVVFNKMDLYKLADFNQLKILRKELATAGYNSYVISTENGEGFKEFSALFKHKITAVTGPSGVGKTSLLNRLNPQLNLHTKQISKHNEKGQHTTTFSRMHELTDGGFVIDTPGIKEYGVAGINAYELSFYFPEMRERLQDCKFNNCQHIKEPGCAILADVNKEKIPTWRYDSYVMIREELLEENKHYL